VKTKPAERGTAVERKTHRKKKKTNGREGCPGGKKKTLKIRVCATDHVKAPNHPSRLGKNPGKHEVQVVLRKGGGTFKKKARGAEAIQTGGTRSSDLRRGMKAQRGNCS